MGVNLEEYAWTEELRKIINDYKEGSPDEPLDGDEVETLVNHLRNKINLMEGNITWDEYLEQEEKDDKTIKISVEQFLDGHNWEELEEAIKEVLVNFGVNARIENPNTVNSVVARKEKQ